IPTVIGIKEASGSLDQASQIRALCPRLSLLSGDDSLTLPILSIGGQGVVSVVGNLVPQDVNRLIKTFAAGHVAEAAALHMKLFPLCRDLLGAATNPIPVKTAMMLLGRDCGELRLPLCRPDDAVQARIRQALEAYGLTKTSHN